MDLPKHIAIIMDGNGRWAQLKRRPRTFGHIKGTRVAKKIITACSRRGIKNLTLYAFSTENWFRPEAEVSLLMLILRRYLKRETENLVKENIRFSVIGDLSRVPLDVANAIEKSIEATSQCTGLNLVFALSYGSRQEITQAVREIAEKVAAGEMSPAEIDESMINSALSTFPTPDPDLIIRTSGEQRLSNFLLWQAAYSEFYFTEVLWPNFTESHLDEALQAFAMRQRRYGKVSSNDNNHEKLPN
ncbi:isoprenyl transferase [Bdellovibrio bacteriovorus]|uniref:Isoprenyl transferase n=1 Tax=Bdellovibrio bacteriovorus str. Tiberius TaxID=1069642 RepID=K7ZHC2_BDEBC|nr:isoprenyl transferase [Bdellovibrio bacteriovorus]AFY03337.1 undecaprenyl pyrophosphate synthetase [Bdellovibrio bacteriovorus str. Tiberius]